MSTFGKHNVAFFVAIYVSLLNVIYNANAVLLSVLIIVAVYFVLIFKSNKLIMLYPFFTYPFMFLIRAQDPSNIILITLPEIFTIVAMLIYLIQNNLRFVRNWHLSLLSIYALLTFLILVSHVGDVRYIPIVLRQYILPILFLIVFIDASIRSPRLPIDALKISISSFAVVGALSLLNIFAIVTVPDTFEPLKPYLNYSSELDLNFESEGKATRRLTDNLFMPRLNLFAGGSFGSAAAIYFSLALIPFMGARNEFSWKYKVMSFLLMLTSLMTLSVSILIAIFAFSFVYFVRKKNKGALIPIGFIVLYILLFENIFVDRSSLTYLNDTTVTGLMAYLNQIDLTAFVIGSGPSLLSEGYEFLPKLVGGDVGVVRVFTEMGVVDFFLFFVFLVLVFRLGIRIVYKASDHNGRLYVLLFIVFIFLVHGNITAQPPFFPLFAACVAGIIAIEAIRKKRNLESPQKWTPHESSMFAK